MKRIYRFLMTLTIFSLFMFGVNTLFADFKKDYLVITKDRKILSEIQKISTIKFQKGRIKVVNLIDESSYQNFKSYLKPINMNEIKVYRPQIVGGQKLKFDEALNDYSSIRVKERLEKLVGFRSRKFGTEDNSRVQDWLIEEFQKIGLSSTKSCFSSWFSKGCNVVATIPGTDSSNKKIIIVGHFDTVGKEYAGADDNGSGTVGILEIAEMLKSLKLKHTLIFVPMDGEESGYIGSKDYVKKLSSTDDIRFVINMDMIGYNRSNIVAIETNGPFVADAERLASMFTQYTKYTPEISTSAWGSDHVPFLNANISAAMTIQDWNEHNPCYHKSCDTLDIIDYDFMEGIIKANSAMILSLDEEL